MRPGHSSSAACLKFTNFASSSTAGDPQQVIIGQSYVQFQIPNKRRQWPLILVHGSNHTGADVDATPNGTEGWLAHAVRDNLATFVMDQPGRGRSGSDSSVIHEAKAKCGRRRGRISPASGYSDL
jgi:hypothetical protein